MMEELVRMYEKGAITADHLAVESLHRLDPADPALVLKSLPREVLLRMLGYADQYRPGAMRTNYGLQPAPDQVSAAKQWIEVNIVNAKSGGDKNSLPLGEQQQAILFALRELTGKDLGSSAKAWAKLPRK